MTKSGSNSRGGQMRGTQGVKMQRLIILTSKCTLTTFQLGYKLAMTADTLPGISIGVKIC